MGMDSRLQFVRSAEDLAIACKDLLCMFSAIQDWKLQLLHSPESASHVDSQLHVHKEELVATFLQDDATQTSQKWSTFGEASAEILIIHQLHCWILCLQVCLASEVEAQASADDEEDVIIAADESDEDIDTIPISQYESGLYREWQQIQEDFFLPPPRF